MKTREVRAKGKKLKPMWVGPGVIKWLGDRGAAGVKDLDGKVKVYNLDCLKHYVGSQVN